MKIVSTYDHVETDTRVYVMDNGDGIPFWLSREKARGSSAEDETARTQKIIDDVGMIFITVPADNETYKRVIDEGERVWQIVTQ